MAIISLPLYGLAGAANGRDQTAGLSHCPSTGSFSMNAVTRNATRTTPQVYQSPARSEEHTSELQSLMRISYAVFCLKKKKEHTTTSLHSMLLTYDHTS